MLRRREGEGFAQRSQQVGGETLLGGRATLLGGRAGTGVCCERLFSPLSGLGTANRLEEQGSLKVSTQPLQTGVLLQAWVNF